MKGKKASTDIKQAKAFEIYCAMPEGDRSYAKLRLLLRQDFGNITKRSIEMWSRRYHWQDKIKAAAEKMMEESAERAKKALSISSLSVIKEQQLKISQVAISQLLTKLRNDVNAGSPPEFSYSDLERFLRHQWLVVGGMKESLPAVNPINAIQVNLSPAGIRFEEVITKMPKDMVKQILREKIAIERKQQHKTNIIKAEVKEIPAAVHQGEQNQSIKEVSDILNDLG